MNKFPETLKYIRKHTKYNNKIGMTIRDLTNESGVSNPYISQLERKNSEKKPSKEIIKKLATGLTIQSNLNENIMSDFLFSLSHGNNIEPQQVLKVANSLIDTHYVDFLNIIVDSKEGIKKLNIKDPENIIKDLNVKEHEQNIKIVKQLEESMSKIFLNRILNEDNIELIFDNRTLNKTEVNWIKSTLLLLREKNTLK